MPDPTPRLRWYRRHSAVVRVTHWVNVLCLTVLVMSGMQIFNAHPALYWGQASDFARPLLAIPGGFPSWATLPGVQWLAMGRRWHLFFAWVFVVNGVVYLVSGLASGHFRADLWPSRRDLAGIGGTIAEHLGLHFPKGAAARHYNVLQKLAYCAVVFGALPLIALAGMALSPRLDSVFPLVWLFDGRQSARSIHFLIASLLVVFVAVHVIMVVLSGLWNNLRAMITGRSALDETADD